MDENDWHAALAVNMSGTVAVTQAASARWQQAGAEMGRAVIDTSSPVGVHPSHGAVACSVSKEAIASFTLAITPTLAPFGVRVNAVAPVGRSRMTDGSSHFRDLMAAPLAGEFDRVRPVNVAPLMVYLASSSCAFTSRVCGIEGDDVFLLDGWSAEQRASNGAKRWASAGLAAATASLGGEDESWARWPGGRRRVKTPDDASRALFSVGGP